MLKLFIFILEIAFVIAVVSMSSDDFLDNRPLLTVAIQFLFFVAVIDAVRRSINFSYGKRYRLSAHQKMNFQYGINNISRVLIFLALVVSMFRLFGVDPKSLLTSLSIVAAAVAIITKDYITDFLVGLYFSFSKDFEINDYVRIGEYKGKITELQMLKMRILNDDDHSVLIPNSKAYNQEIINYTKRDFRLMSIDFQINIANVGNLEALEAELVSSLSDFDEFIEPNSFVLKIVEMKKDYIDLKFLYKLKRFDRELQQEIRRKTVRQVFSHITDKIAGAAGGSEISA